MAEFFFRRSKIEKRRCRPKSKMGRILTITAALLSLSAAAYAQDGKAKIRRSR